MLYVGTNFYIELSEKDGRDVYGDLQRNNAKLRGKKLYERLHVSTKFTEASDSGVN